MSDSIIIVTLALINSLYTFVAVGNTTVVSRHVGEKMIWSVSVPREEGRLRYKKLLTAGAKRQEDTCPQCSDCGQYGHSGCMDNVVQP